METKNVAIKDLHFTTLTPTEATDYTLWKVVKSAKRNNQLQHAHIQKNNQTA